MPNETLEETWSRFERTVLELKAERDAWKKAADELSNLFECDCDSGFDRPELSTHRQSCILWKVANIYNAPLTRA